VRRARACLLDGATFERLVATVDLGAGLFHKRHLIRVRVRVRVRLRLRLRVRVSDPNPNSN
jgi:hypothetical protein|tara:strand:- start:195 stop:377 length:183 start_codon:yes stop_codon:yes gene_type:complete